MTETACTILIADDTPANLLLLGNLLRSQGYKITEAQDGIIALEQARRTLPDLIFLDVHMPGLTGYEVCEQLKADKMTKDIPVIFISAIDDSDAIVKAFEVGGVDYIAKPLRFKEVLARTQSHLTVLFQRREIETLRRQDHQQFEAINRMKTHFIGATTHDLKNPMSVIISYIALMERQPDIVAHPVAQQSLQGIRDGVNKMAELVTNMLDSVQLESEIELSLVVTSLNGFLKDCLNGFNVVASQKQIQFTQALPHDDVKICIDAKLMKRVMDNLISNALKYTPKSGHVEITARSEENHAVIQVKDTGMGIPPEDLPHIFKAFYRVQHQAHEKIEGTGLGLSIVKAIVEQHKGQISVESTVGKGSTFSITLPLRPNIA